MDKMRNYYKTQNIFSPDNIAIAMEIYADHVLYCHLMLVFTNSVLFTLQLKIFPPNCII